MSNKVHRAVELGPEWICAHRDIVLTDSLNMHNTVFGGVVLSKIDLAAMVQAQTIKFTKWVTASFQRVDFKKPVCCGDMISIYTRTVKEGNSSVEIECKVEVKRFSTGEVEEVTTAFVTMVCIGTDGKSQNFRD